MKYDPVSTEQEVLATVKAVALDQGWTDYRIDESGVMFEESGCVFFEGGEWSVVLLFNPNYTGNHVTVFISPDGEVRVMPGL